MKKYFSIVLALFLFLIYKDVNADTLCKRATTLHTEECTTKGDGCVAEGYTIDGEKGTTTITYGNLGIPGILASGDAFDCDVNGDGIYDSSTERFYYVTDLDADTAVLIFYNNVVNGVASTEQLYSCGYGQTNYNGPTNIIRHLPTITQWSNVSLKQPIRAIVNHNGEPFIYIRTDIHYLPTDFSYDGYSTRLLTYQEIQKSCTLEQGINHKELQDCIYLLENLNYSGNHNSGDTTAAYFLENPTGGYNSYDVMTVHDTTVIGSSNGNYGYGARPVIEVSKDRIEGSKDTDTEIKSSDSNISLSGKISELYQKKLEVKEFLKDSEVYKRLQSIFKDKKSIIAYNFDLYDSNNNIVEPESKITVNIKLPEGINQEKLKLWYISEEYNQQELSYSIKDNILSFETDHFSIYALTEDIEGEVVQVADTAFSITKLGVSIGLVILVLGVMVIVQTLLKDKQKNQ